MSAALRLNVFVAMVLLVATACTSDPEVPPDSSTAAPDESPSILLITLDTTRADALGLESDAVVTPEMAALAARGLLFTQAYSTVPTTLPSHTSMMTGLYPAGHGIRENGRRVSEKLDLLSGSLKESHYTTAAFVSGFPLASEFGLARDFDLYDDEFGEGRTERTAGETTDRALAFLKTGKAPLFLWVHYFDPHEPYEPPEPFRTRYAGNPYLGEIVYMDEQVGRLVVGFNERLGAGAWRIVVVGDHGESRGDHGETLHGNLLYQGAMRVPLILAGSEIEPGVVERAVSVRQIFGTVLDWAGMGRQGGLLEEVDEPVLAEAMKPYLQYGWQPQFMAVEDGIKVIRSGETEVYDVRADPAEIENLAGQIELEPSLRQALSAYADEALSDRGAAGENLSQESREKLASLGYFGSEGRPALRDDAPSPKDMVHLYRDLDIGASLFIRREYEQAIPVFARVAEADPQNFMVALRLAVAYSVVGNETAAMESFARAREIDASSVDLRHYQAMHHFRNQKEDLAQPLFESVLVQMPDRLPALEALAQIYTRQGRIDDATRMLERVVRIKESPGLELARFGELRMAVGDTAGAIRAFERSRGILGEQFTYNLELGVAYLANRQLSEAAASLDRVSPFHPGYPMALFKRAQVSVLLGESDRVARVHLAYAKADNATRPLIESEQLFRDISPPN